MTKTLIYLGAGWDSSFLKLKYDKYILIDQIPKYPYYEPCHYGYKEEKNFFETLKKKFGNPGQSPK